MFDERTVQVGRTVFILDIVVTIIVFIFSFWSRNLILMDYQGDLYSHIALLPLILSLLVAFLSYFGAYAGPRNITMIHYTWSVFRAVTFAMGMLLTLLFLLKIQYVSRFVIVFFATVEFIVLSGIRVCVRIYFLTAIKKGTNRLKILIIGTGGRARELCQALNKQVDWGIEIIGHLDPDHRRVGQNVLNAPVIGTIDDIHNCLKKHVVDEVIIAIPRSLLEDAEHIALACDEEGIKLRFMADLFSLDAARIRLIQAGSIPLLTLEPVAQDELKLLIKRCIDLFLTIFTLPFLLLIVALVAIAIKFDSKGPVFFVQRRVGLKKRQFPMIKFRSMFVDAEERLKEIEHLNEAEGPIFKMANDPRVTRVGHFLRKTSLDEVPQLFNVLKGEMSLVGPRPMSIRDVDLFDKGIQRKRFSVKPGLTCLWQVSGRSNLPFEKWLELDLKYIGNWTLWLDFKILIKTIPAVLFSKGAV